MFKIGIHHSSHRKCILLWVKQKAAKTEIKIPFCYWTSICPLHAQWCCTGIIFSKSLQNGVAVKQWLSWVTMTHHHSDPSLLLTLTVKGYFPPFPTHYSWVEWPHPTRTLSTTAASCSWHQYRCCIPLLNRREQPRFVDTYGQKECQKPEGSKTALKARHLAWKSICVLPLSSNNERNKRSFPCSGASFLISHANYLACKGDFPGSF